MDRVVSSTHLGGLPPPLGRLRPPPLAVRAVLFFNRFLIFFVRKKCNPAMLLL